MFTSNAFLLPTKSLYAIFLKMKKKKDEYITSKMQITLIIYVLHTHTIHPFEGRILEVEKQLVEHRFLL
jgi:hypothetical protein